MTGRILRFWPIVLLAALLGGCGGGGGSSSSTSGTSTATTTEQTSTSESTVDTMQIRIYLLQGGKVLPVLREIEATKAVAAAALQSLSEGPAPGGGLETAVPVDFHPPVALANGVARLNAGAGLSVEGKAQVVFTLTQFASIRKVELAGKTYERSDFEAQTPLILVDSPVEGTGVSSPIQVSGTANTFEANVQWELEVDGKVVRKGFTTATSGNGTRGTFEFSVPYTKRGVTGSLILFQTDEANGGRRDVVYIPLYLT